MSGRIHAEPFPLAKLELMSRICFHCPKLLLGPGCLNHVVELPHSEGIVREWNGFIVHACVC